MARKALSLARFNNKLAYGSWQQSLHHFANKLSFNAQTPICFNLTTPSLAEPVHQYLPSGTNTYDLSQPTTFEIPPLGFLTGQGPNSGGYEPWNQWRNSNDILNGKYKLLTQKLAFHFEAGSSSTSCRLRIDFVKPRYNRVIRYSNPSVPAQGENHLLPDSLGGFVNMLEGNMINPLYWRTVKTVFKTIAPGDDLTTSKIQKTVFFRLNKVINPITTASTTTYPSSKISLNNQIWCIISTDYRGGSTGLGQPTVNVYRHTTWRDAQGHAA
jgi:hypothetical protein